MKKIITIVIIGGFITLSWTVYSTVVKKSSKKSIATETHMTEEQILSRTFGHLFIRQLNLVEDYHFDNKEIILGMQNELNSVQAPLSDEEYAVKMEIVQKKAFEDKAKSNLVSAENFLDENIKEKNVVEIVKNKLQYKIIKEGSGGILEKKGSPLLHYKGSLINGEVFSSSYDSKEPILLPLSQTIPGFSEGVMGMKEGEIREIYIHPEMAYGVVGHLPPNSLLIFEVELIKSHQDPIEENLSTKISPEVDKHKKS